ncbi:MAG: enoyl-CoA hydratase/isomerase family protein [Bacteroidota bacterium]|nr:enoyl-CoA hydratase/isomerase family protein [Bacteroidota bacterium]
MKTSFKTLSVTYDDGLVHLEINQPPSNRMNSLFFNELSSLVDELCKKDGISAIVISGKGRHFSSGADLDDLLQKAVHPEKELSSSGTFSFFERNHFSFLYFEELNIPVISAIRGVCLGSAMELALFSHFRFCSEDAVMGLPESTFNLIPGIGGTSHLIKLAGLAKGLELVLHGEMFSAADALQYGIVDKILPRKEVVPFALEFAKKISVNYYKEKKTLYLNSAA